MCALAGGPRRAIDPLLLDLQAGAGRGTWESIEEIYGADHAPKVLAASMEDFDEEFGG